jgi:hypothetical protein
MITPTQHPDGSISLNVDTDTLKRIDIENLLTLASFSRRFEGDDTVIEAEFDSGGKFEMRHTTDGDITHFRCFHMGMRVSPDHVVSLRAFDPDMQQE